MQEIMEEEKQKEAEKKAWQLKKQQEQAHLGNTAWNGREHYGAGFNANTYGQYAGSPGSYDPYGSQPNSGTNFNTVADRDLDWRRGGSNSGLEADPAVATKTAERYSSKQYEEEFSKTYSREPKFTSDPVDRASLFGTAKQTDGPADNSEELPKSSKEKKKDKEQHQNKQDSTTTGGRDNTRGGEREREQPASGTTSAGGKARGGRGEYAAGDGGRADTTSSYSAEKPLIHQHHRGDRAGGPRSRQIDLQNDSYSHSYGEDLQHSSEQHHPAAENWRGGGSSAGNGRVDRERGGEDRSSTTMTRGGTGGRENNLLNRNLSSGGQQHLKSQYRRDDDHADSYYDRDEDYYLRDEVGVALSRGEREVEPSTSRNNAAQYDSFNPRSRTAAGSTKGGGQHQDVGSYSGTATTSRGESHQNHPGGRTARGEHQAAQQHLEHNTRTPKQSIRGSRDVDQRWQQQQQHTGDVERWNKRDGAQEKWDQHGEEQWNEYEHEEWGEEEQKRWEQRWRKPHSPAAMSQGNTTYETTGESHPYTANSTEQHSPVDLGRERDPITLNSTGPRTRADPPFGAPPPPPSGPPPRAAEALVMKVPTAALVTNVRETLRSMQGKCTLKHLATKQKDFSAKSGKNLDDFLMEHPDVFKIDGSTVTLLEDTRYLTKDTSNTEEIYGAFSAPKESPSHSKDSYSKFNASQTAARENINLNTTEQAGSLEKDRSEKKKKKKDKYWEEWDGGQEQEWTKEEWEAWENWGDDYAEKKKKKENKHSRKDPHVASQRHPLGKEEDLETLLQNEVDNAYGDNHFDGRYKDDEVVDYDGGDNYDAAEGTSKSANKGYNTGSYSNRTGVKEQHQGSSSYDHHKGSSSAQYNNKSSNKAEKHQDGTYASSSRDDNTSASTSKPGSSWYHDNSAKESRESRRGRGGRDKKKEKDNQHYDSYDKDNWYQEDKETSKTKSNMVSLTGTAAKSSSTSANGTGDTTLVGGLKKKKKAGLSMNLNQTDDKPVAKKEEEKPEAKKWTGWGKPDPDTPVKHDHEFNSTSATSQQPPKRSVPLANGGAAAGTANGSASSGANGINAKGNGSAAPVSATANGNGTTSKSSSKKGSGRKGGKDKDGKDGGGKKGASNSSSYAAEPKSSKDDDGGSNDAESANSGKGAGKKGSSSSKNKGSGKRRGGKKGDKSADDAGSASGEREAGSGKNKSGKEGKGRGKKDKDGKRQAKADAE
ncbi:unnamed protein product [Amoebophrya sp. A120]|nr:unnamed protein product [Amoebophrya sp. A120]|eukprot:GSA120T00000608001.1